MEYSYDITHHTNYPVLYIDDVIYNIQSPGRYGNSAFFEEKCDVCNGTKRVTLKDREYTCPACVTSYNKAENHIELKQYVVAEWHIYGVNIRKRSIVKAQKPIEIKRYMIFWAWGRGYDDMATKEIDPSDIVDDATRTYRDEVHFTRDRKKVEEICARKHQEQREKLAEFNARFGTDYKYPWDDTGKAIKEND